MPKETKLNEVGKAIARLKKDNENQTEIIIDLVSRLDRINKLVYANCITAGMVEYFEIRRLCTKNLPKI